ncbi:hypothetical protein LCGC14_1699390 [marine sediment metagenome]|uniref:dTDP-4-amino-4,6-dideoxygalactose transaminase n=1 Tax=marine sediment metagenome TaxID=412755 RepID=A0A0F9HJ14_9ZZZZ
MDIPFNKPYLSGNEFLYMKDAYDHGKISGDGLYSKKVHEFIETKFGTEKALFVTSCTAALDMSAILIDLKPGDEVIMPSYTFVSTANAILLRNAKIVFAEIEPDTLNIDPCDIMNKITDRTKAIFPIHYAGISCKMDEIQKIANKNNLIIVEDAAQGVNAKYKNKYLGTIGSIGCYSFHETKNYICGEGGAILINKAKYIERAEIIREKGTNRNKFFRGEIDKYTWVDIGSSYIGSDLLAAYLWAQFEKLDEIQQRRKTIYNRYYNGLTELAEKGLLRLPTIPSYSESNYHMFYIILKNESLRNKLLKELKKLKIGAVFHYIPLHLSTMGIKLGYNKGDFPLTEDLSNRLVRLPMYYELTDSEIDYIIKKTKEII